MYRGDNDALMFDEEVEEGEGVEYVKGRVKDVVIRRNGLLSTLVEIRTH